MTQSSSGPGTDGRRPSEIVLHRHVPTFFAETGGGHSIVLGVGLPEESEDEGYHSVAPFTVSGEPAKLESVRGDSEGDA